MSDPIDIAGGTARNAPQPVARKAEQPVWWPVWPVPKEKDAGGIADNVFIAGYLFAWLVPPIGFIIGLTQINKNRHGLRMVIVSVVFFILTLLYVWSSFGGY